METESRILCNSNSHERLFEERHFLPNGCILLFSKDCPSLIKQEIHKKTEEEGTNWIPTRKTEIEYQSRRDVYFPNIDDGEGNYPVIKRKKKQTQWKNESMRLDYFTDSLIHEVRTSYLLDQVLATHTGDLPSTITYDDDYYKTNYFVQEPWGVLVNTHNNHDRFNIFKRSKGVSLREYVSASGGWNSLEQQERMFVAQIHKALNQLSYFALEVGLEPWDLGVHQIVYDINKDYKEINLTILDTEEYNITAQFGHHWTASMLKYGLPPVILFL